MSLRTLSVNVRRKYPLSSTQSKISIFRSKYGKPSWAPETAATSRLLISNSGAVKPLRQNSHNIISWTPTSTGSYWMTQKTLTLPKSSICLSSCWSKTPLILSNAQTDSYTDNGRYVRNGLTITEGWGSVLPFSAPTQVALVA